MPEQTPSFELEDLKDRLEEIDKQKQMIDILTGDARKETSFLSL